MKIWKHFKTITWHRLLVCKECFGVGLYRQGLCHDLSKYSPSEFIVGAKYFQGDRSPNNAERENIGYSSAWLHHKGRNKHHYEYWIDYSLRSVPGGMAPAPMPMRYIIEMLMDRVAACKVYNKGHYTSKDPWEYYLGGREVMQLHAKTKAVLELLLYMLMVSGEKETYRFAKKEFLANKKKWDNQENLEALLTFCKQKTEALQKEV